jgi:hypothetical protein
MKSEYKGDLYVPRMGLNIHASDLMHNSDCSNANYYTSE